MTRHGRATVHEREIDHGEPESSRCIEWFSQGQGRVVEAGDLRILIRLVGRKGRRARIAITAPAGTVIRST